MTADEKLVDETAEFQEAVGVENASGVDSAQRSDDGAALSRLKRFRATLKKRLSGRVLPALLALLVVASLALVSGLFYFLYLPDRDTDTAASKAAVSAATDGTVAVLSYSPESLDRDFASAKSHLTGDFLSYYEQFTQQIVAPAAKQKSVKTNAVVLRSAVSTLHPDSAVVLLFVNQSTQSKDRPEPTFTSSSISVTLTKVDGKWLISSFTPL